MDDDIPYAIELAFEQTNGRIRDVLTSVYPASFSPVRQVERSSWGPMNATTGNSLSARHHRPRRRTAERPDEHAPSHLSLPIKPG